MPDLFETYDETTSSDSFSLQNGKLLKVDLRGATIQAKLGSMVAYQGDVTFAHAGSGGVGGFVRKAVTGEGQTLMKVSGTGEVFLADTAQDVHRIRLQGEKLTINGRNLLAFEDGISWSIERLKTPGAMVGGGLFNTTLQGTGWVAILTEGPPVRLDVGSQPTFADPQAAVAWSGGVDVSVKTAFSAKNLIGRGSGESIQLAYSGQGWVLVQPSEGRPVVAPG